MLAASTTTGQVRRLLFVTQYMLSANSGSSPMYCLENLNAAWPKAYAREFEAIWRFKSKALAADEGSSGALCGGL
jgi:hypothetical protein